MEPLYIAEYTITKPDSFLGKLVEPDVTLYIPFSVRVLRSTTPAILFVICSATQIYLHTLV